MNLPPRLLPVLLCLLLSVAYGSTPRPLVVGVFPRYPEQQTERRFAPLVAYLSDRLNRPVRLRSAPDFAAFWDLVSHGHLDLVHYNQYHYIKAHARFGHRAILKNQESGQDRIRAAILVPADSPVKRIEDLKGRKILFGGGRGAMVSYILARRMLSRHGLRPDDYLSAFSSTPVSAVRDLFFGQGDAAGIGEVILKRRDTPWKDLGWPAPRLLALSEPIPQLPWAVTPNVDRDTALRIQAALLALNNTGQGQRILAQAGLSGLRTARDADYDPVRRIVQQVLNEQY
jgi:phosphonate transport system substrate-binding protein